jgi:hypothetical protein
MAGITLQQAETQLALYLDAEAKVLAGQRVRIGDKDITRADLEFVQKGIDLWQGRVIKLERATNGIAVKQVIPL